MSAAVEDALRRLQTALGALEVTIGRRLDVEHRRGDLETELQLMQDDRARLAVELESTSARLNRVETATDHIERRLHKAVGTIRDVLSRAETSELREE
jgi:predicted  nucleic acid-binding Zn-ribbon protein